MIAYLLIILGFTMRLIPHVPNMAPVAAIALFSGTYLPKKVVPWVPLAIMVASDLIIGLHDMVLFTWGSFILIGFMGSWLKNRKSWKNIVGASLASSVMFFLVTNFGVWITRYPLTFQGFAECYIKAVPFFRNTLVSDLFFITVLFGSYELGRIFASGSRFKTVLLAD